MADLINTGTKVAFANVAASTTDGALVTAVAGKRIRVLGTGVSCGATPSSVTFNTKPVAAGAAISPAFNNSIVLANNPQGWFDTLAGEGLTVTTGAGSTTGIIVKYAEITP